MRSSRAAGSRPTARAQASPCAQLAEWFARWGEAERAYFTNVRSPESFDLTVATGDDA